VRGIQTAIFSMVKTITILAVVAQFLAAAGRGDVTSQTLSQEAVIAKIQHYDAQVRACPTYFRLRVEESGISGDNAVQQGPFHEYAYDGTRQYYHGSQWTRVAETREFLTETITIWYDGKQSIEKTETALGQQKPSGGICVYGENRINGTGIAGILPGDGASIHQGLLSSKIADKKRYEKLEVRPEKLEGKNCYKVSLIAKPSEEGIFRRDYWIDPENGFRTLKSVYSRDGQTLRVHTFKKWTEVQKEVFVPLESRIEVYFGSDSKTRVTIAHSYFAEEVRAGNNFPFKILDVELPVGADIWDARFNIGYTICQKGKLLKPEEVQRLKNAEKRHRKQ
jgi:hypothetical protein